MKKKLFIPIFAVLLFSCSENNTSAEVKDGKAKLEYFVETLDAAGLAGGIKLDETRIDEVYAGLAEKSFEDIDLLVDRLSQENQAREKSNAIYESQEFKTYLRQFEESKSRKDLEQLVLDFPDISELTGLKKQMKEALQNDR